MEHNILHIRKPSLATLKKLRLGHTVRLHHEPIHGEGLNLIVHPENFDIMTRSFRKAQSASVSLTPEEIDANKSYSDSGVEGGKLGRDIVKAGKTNRGRKIINYLVDAGMSLGDAGLKKGGAHPVEGGKFGRDIVKAGKTTRGRKIINYLVDAGMSLGDAGLKKAGAHPVEGGKFGRDIVNAGKTKRGRKIINYLVDAGMSLGDAGLKKAGAHPVEGSGIIPLLHHSAMADARDRIMADRLNAVAVKQKVHGHGLYAGPSGGSIVGLSGGFLRGGALQSATLPPALQSQNLSTNFMMANQLPVQFQKINRSGAHHSVLGSGLY